MKLLIMWRRRMGWVRTVARSEIGVHRSRSRRSRSQGTQHVMTSFPWRDLRHYSPTHVLLQVDYSSPNGFYSPLVPSIIPLDSSHSFDPYGPHSVQLYTPPPKAAPCMIPLLSPFPISKMFYTSFITPPYSDPYGPTAIQLYSAYNPKPLQRRSNISEAICPGENQCEADPFGNRLTHSDLSRTRNDLSPMHIMFCPMLGLLITALLIIITLCASAVICALRQRGHHARDSDNNEPLEHVKDSSSFEHFSRSQHLESDNGDHAQLPSREDNYLRRNVDSDSLEEIKKSRNERPDQTKMNKKSSVGNFNAEDQVKVKNKEAYEDSSGIHPINLNEARRCHRNMLSEILPYASKTLTLSSGHDVVDSLEVIEELADLIQGDIISEILYSMVPPPCHSYCGGRIWKCKESPEIIRAKSTLSTKKQRILESGICPGCGYEFIQDIRDL